MVRRFLRPGYRASQTRHEVLIDDVFPAHLLGQVVSALDSPEHRLVVAGEHVGQDVRQALAFDGLDLVALFDGEIDRLVDGHVVRQAEEIALDDVVVDGSPSWASLRAKPMHPQTLETTQIAPKHSGSNWLMPNGS